jgi:multicomponent Na+:H+ antiporter subunit C
MNIAIYLIIISFSISLYAVIVEQNLFKKILFVSLMQTSIIIYYIISVWNLSASTPFYTSTNTSNYVDPVPQVLMLTAIVVGFASTALCLAVVMRIKKKTGTIMYNEIDKNTDYIHNNGTDLFSKII